MTQPAPGQTDAATRHGLAEVIRAARAIHPHFQNEGRLTFQMKPGNHPNPWSEWRDSIWLEILVPALLRARGAAKLELLEIDLAIDRALPPEAAERSRLAGKRLSAAWTAPHGEKRLRAWSQIVASNQTPGHLATLWAIRAEMFHYGPEITAATYLLLEGQGTLATGKGELLAEMLGDCLATFSRQRESKSAEAA